MLLGYSETSHRDAHDDPAKTGTKRIQPSAAISGNPLRASRLAGRGPRASWRPSKEEFSQCEKMEYALLLSIGHDRQSAEVLADDTVRCGCNIRRAACPGANPLSAFDLGWYSAELERMANASRATTCYGLYVKRRATKPLAGPNAASYSSFRRKRSCPRRRQAQLFAESDDVPK